MIKIISLTIIASIILSVSCDTSKLVSLPYKERVVKIDVVSYERAGAKVINSFNKNTEIKNIYDFLINKKIKVKNPSSRLSPPRESAKFIDHEGKTLFIIWFGSNWITGQDELKDHMSEIWKVTNSDINEIKQVLMFK